jgi:hypothetical protein
MGREPDDTVSADTETGCVLYSQTWRNNHGVMRSQSCVARFSRNRRLSYASYREITPFDRCTDPGMYPRRYWLCRIAAYAVP